MCAEGLWQRLDWQHSLHVEATGRELLNRLWHFLYILYSSTPMQIYLNVCAMTNNATPNSILISLKGKIRWKCHFDCVTLLTFRRNLIKDEVICLLRAYLYMIAIIRIRTANFLFMSLIISRLISFSPLHWALRTTDGRFD